MKTVVSWSRQTHGRFSSLRRRWIFETLLIQRRTNCMPRDVLLGLVLPCITVEIPRVYVGYLRLDHNDEMLLKSLIGRLLAPVQRVEIQRYQDGSPKGYALIEFYCIDDISTVVTSEIVVHGRLLRFGLMKE